MIQWSNNRVNRINWFENQSLASIKIFESAANKVVEQKIPVGDIPIYVCGITPYDSAHLGHAFTYSVFDVLVRFIKQSGHAVSYVQNITDVDDPLFERARRDNISWREIADKQVKKFVDDMQTINVDSPDHFVAVSQEIPAILKDIEKLHKAGLVYQVDHDWYFENKDNTNFLTPKLSKKDLIKIFEERGGDPSRPGKHDPLDPVVFKKSLADEESYESSLGAGRPGWHIECVSIINKYLSTPLFIQGGGKDLIYPHHTMCANQSKKLTNIDLATNYLHAGMVAYQGEKMSKSLGNLVFVSELVNSGYSGASIKLNLLDRAWHSDWEWAESDLKECESRITTWKQTLPKILADGEIINFFFNALKDNLNTKSIFNFLDQLKPMNSAAIVLEDSVAALVSDTLGLSL